MKDDELGETTLDDSSGAGPRPADRPSDPGLVVVRTLGEGGMGQVLLCRDRILEREVAVKVLRTGLGDEARARFLREARITGQLEHPNIVPVYGLEASADREVRMVLRCVRGRTLAEVLADEARRGGDPERGLERLLDVFGKICDAVGYAHDRGILHRDLKPENVMVGGFGEVLVMDWGLAKVVGERDSGSGSSVLSTADARLTRDGSIAGTPAYMSPEQAEGRIGELDARSDVYSLGAVLYEILSLRKPFEGGSVLEVLEAVASHDFRPPRQRSRAPWTIPRELEAIVLKAMSRDPRDRYPTTAALWEDVEAFRACRPVSAAPDGPRRRLVKWVRRHPNGALVAAITIVFATTLGLIVALLRGRASEAERRAALHEARAEREERDRLRAEHELERQEQIELLRTGEIEALYDKLGLQMKRDFERSVEEFEARYGEAMRSSPDGRALGRRIDLSSARRYLAAFDRFLEEHERHPERVEATGRHYFIRGALHHLLGDLDEAIADYGVAVDRDGNLVALYQMGAVRREKGDLEAALGDHDRAVERAPDRAIGYFHRGTTRSALGDRTGALADFDQAVRLDPGHAPSWHNRGGVHLALGQPEEALTDFDRAVALDADFVLPRIGRGRTLVDLDRPAEAMEAFAEALAIEPRSAEAYRARGMAWLRQGKPLEAIEDVSEAIRLDPDHPDAYLDRGTAYERLGRLEEAMADRRTLVRLRPDAVAHHNLATTLFLAGRLEEARASFGRSLELDPDHVDARFGRAAAALRLGDPEAATSDFARIAGEHPDHWRAWQGLGLAHAGRRRLDEARRAFERARATCPPSMLETVRAEQEAALVR